jgi:NADH-quinone oxidoreductase subunit I
MCEQACPCDAIELTTLFDLTGLSREEMMFDKEKLLSVFDQTVAAGTDPVRTRRGALSVASEPEPRFTPGTSRPEPPSGTGV